MKAHGTSVAAAVVAVSLCAPFVIAQTNKADVALDPRAERADAAVAAPADPTLDARVKALSTELRCLVCQNQTVADSDAPVARDMREQVRAQLAAGKTEDEVKRYMTDRFGDFVLYRPPLKATTMVLWAAPFVALILAAFLLVRRLRRPSIAAQAVPSLSEADRARAQSLLSRETR